MIKKNYLKTFEQINYHLCNGKRVYVGKGEYFTREYGAIVYNDSSSSVKYYNARIKITPYTNFWIEEEIKDPSIKPEIGFVFETNKGTQVYINLKKGNKFYGAELNGKQNSCKVFNEDGRVERRNIYLVKKVK